MQDISHAIKDQDIMNGNKYQPTDWLALKNKVCAITGAASGIGAAIAQSAAQAGAKVALLDRDIATCEKTAAALAQQGACAIAVPCDTSDQDSLVKAAASVQQQLGICTALVNNAGILRAASLASVTVEEWNQVIAVNLTGYLLTARIFAEQMRQAGGGSIVHIASVSAHFPQTQSGAYSATKAGILLLSRQMAVEWGAAGIRSNAVCPGMIRTQLSAPFYAIEGIEERRSAVTASHRIGEPQDIANAALFLLSERSSYINGGEIPVDGGMSSMLMDLVPRPGYNDITANQIKSA